MSSKRIYLVDDDYIFRTVSTVLLERELQAVEISEYENGLEVFNRLIEIQDTPELLPDIMFLDINMPVMNGWELLEELKASLVEIQEKIQIHILTSSIAPEDLNLSRTYDFIDGYITKPLTKEDIDKINQKPVLD